MLGVYFWVFGVWFFLGVWICFVCFVGVGVVGEGVGSFGFIGFCLVFEVWFSFVVVFVCVVGFFDVCCLFFVVW